MKPNKLEDMFVLEEIIDAFLFYRSKKIYMDLIILNEEKNQNQYVKNSIEEIILNKQVGYLKNISTGIYIFEEYKLSEEEKEIFEFKSKIIIKNEDTLKSFLKSIKPQHTKLEFSKNKIEIEEKNMVEEYSNSYGEFSNDGKEYYMVVTKNNNLPTVWSNILANKFFGTLVTDNMGGFTWNKNSRLNRLTAWNNDPILNFPSEIIYIKDLQSNKVWTLNNNINNENLKCKITYGFGYARYVSELNHFYQETTIFVPNTENFKVTKIKFRNNSDEKKTLKILLYVKNVLGEDEIFTSGNINLIKYGNAILAKNCIEQEGFENKIMFLLSNLKIRSCTGEKEDFFGEGDIEFPDSLYKESLNNKTGLGKDNCIAVQYEIEIQAYEEKQFFIILGQETKIEEIDKILNEYDIDKIEKELIDTTKNWENILGTIKLKLPDKDLENLLNGWILYQTISSRLYAKSSYYQSGGAFGFRDQLQDCLALKYIDTQILRTQIINCARHQFLDGDVLHWWHEETKRGIRTKFSDDLLWLVYSVIEYIEFCGDYSILDEQVEYLKGDLLDKNEDEKYNIFYHTEEKESIYEHCIRAIEKSLNFESEQIPKIGTGDWNDGFSNLGRKGKGESVWLGFFLYDILNRFIPIIKIYTGKENERYIKIKDNLRKTLNSKYWDGRWFKRAINDEGEEIGSINSEECKIDGISQSWAVISGAGDNDKKFISMESAENYLVDKENKIIKLFYPAFEKGKINPGYIKSYTPGMRENGGQYTHAAIWFVMALTILGFGNKALEYLKMISPIEHSKTKQDIDKYKVEPYTIVADIYSTKGLEGRGGWSWYTGSGSWFYKVAIENILGFKIINNVIQMNPVIPSYWKEYEIQYKYKTSIYNIKVINYNMKNSGVGKITLNGEELKENKIYLIDNGKINNIEIFL